MSPPAARVRAAYSALYRRLPVPRSVAAAPRLPPEPVSRRFGLDRGRPVDRVYIEAFLARHAADVRGRVLEIAEPTYTRRFGGEQVQRSDVLDAAPDAPGATLRGDLATGEGLPRDAFDCFLCTQTFQLVPDVGTALGHARAALAPNGVLLATFPGISQLSQPDVEAFPDFWRFTRRGVERLVAGRFAHAEVEAHGTLAAAAALLYGLAEHELDPAALGPHDPDYEVTITLRAVR